MSRLAKLSRISWRDWGLLAEIALLLALSRAAIAFVPFRHIARVLGAAQAETSAEAHPAEERARRIGRLIRGMARNAPWNCKCLAQAMTGKVMLARRGIPCTLYLGVRSESKAPLQAHAWLRSGAVYVTGGRERGNFAVLATFADEA